MPHSARGETQCKGASRTGSGGARSEPDRRWTAGNDGREFMTDQPSREATARQAKRGSCAETVRRSHGSKIRPEIFFRCSKRRC